MSRIICYTGYFCAVLLGLVRGPPIIDPNDPLEVQGDFTYERISEEIPFSFENRDDIIESELFVPEDIDPYAFILFMPGFGSGYSSYEEYLEHLASHGFVSLGMDFAGSSISIDGEHDIKAQQALTAIEYIQNTYPAFSNLPVYTAGHSLGGKIAFYSASLDDSIIISGVIALDPVNAGGPPCAIFPNQCTEYPVAPNPVTGQQGILSNFTTGSSFIVRSAPAPSNPDEQFNAENFFFGSDGNGQDATPSPSLYYDFGNFPHSGYWSCLPSTQVQIIKRTMVAWLQQEVLGINRDEYLTGERIQQDIEK
jgi:hypothetical protein